MYEVTDNALSDVIREQLFLLQIPLELVRTVMVLSATS